jgi:hypothetical protein
MVPDPFSYPARRFLYARDWWHFHRYGTRPVNGHRPRGWTSDLFCSQPRPELGVSPVESCLRPWRRSNQADILYPLCTVPFYKPAVIQCYCTSCCACFHRGEYNRDWFSLNLKLEDFTLGFRTRYADIAGDWEEVVAVGSEIRTGAGIAFKINKKGEAYEAAENIGWVDGAAEGKKLADWAAEGEKWAD